MNTQEYLLSHGLSKAFVTKKLHWNIKEDRIDIPVHDIDGTTPYTRTRMLSGDAKFLITPGVRPSIPYGIDRIQDATDIVFCEGEPDTARLLQSGIPAITFPSGVTSAHSIDPKYLDLLKGRTIHIALDNDDAGQSQVLPLANLLASHGATAKILSFPSSYKDICEYLIDHTTEDFYSLMENAKDADQSRLETFASQFPILTTTEFLATNYPQPKWLISPLIRMDGISLLVGESGTGKTIFSLQVAKAISDGSLFIDKYPSTQLNTLILDKENTPADIQKLAISMGINTPNIHHLFTAEDYQLMDETGHPTPFAESLTLYTAHHHIQVVILDSVIDFLIGDENTSTDVAKNILVWKSIFPGITLLGIHHEGKAPLHGRRSASDRIRGSSVWKSAAQSILSLSVIDPLDPSTILVEHTKVRGGAKCQPFEIHMDITHHDSETQVTGYSFLREVTEEKLTSEKCKDAIVSFLAKNPKIFYSYDQIIQSINNEDFSMRTIRESINDMCEIKDLEKIGKGGRGDAFKVRLTNANSYQEVENYLASETV
jgi:hypothetical protein